MDNAFWNSTTFLDALVAWFNSRPENERSVEQNQLFKVVLRDGTPSVTQSSVNSTIPDTDGFADLHGIATFMWVGAFGTALTATAADFFELGKFVPSSAVEIPTGEINPVSFVTYTVDVKYDGFTLPDDFMFNLRIGYSATNTIAELNVTQGLKDETRYTKSFRLSVSVPVGNNISFYFTTLKLSHKLIVSVLENGILKHSTRKPLSDFPFKITAGTFPSPLFTLRDYDRIKFMDVATVTEGSYAPSGTTDSYVAMMGTQHGAWSAFKFAGAYNASVPSSPKAAVTGKSDRIFVAIPNAFENSDDTVGFTGLYRYDGPNLGFRRQASVPVSDYDDRPERAALKHTRLWASRDKNYIIATNEIENPNGYDDTQEFLGTIYNVSGASVTSVRVAKPAEGWSSGNTAAVADGAGGKLSNLFVGPNATHAIWWLDAVHATYGTVTRSAILLTFSNTTGLLTSRLNLAIPDYTSAFPVCLDFSRVSNGAYLIVANLPFGRNAKNAITTLFQFNNTNGGLIYRTPISAAVYGSDRDISHDPISKRLPNCGVKEFMYMSSAAASYVVALMWSGELIKCMHSGGGQLLQVGYFHNSNIKNDVHLAVNNWMPATYFNEVSETSLSLSPEPDEFVSTGRVLQQGDYVFISADKTLQYPTKIDTMYKDFDRNFDYNYDQMSLRYTLPDFLGAISLVRQYHTLAQLEA